MFRTPHRWLGLIAALFFLNAGMTGTILEISNFIEDGDQDKKLDASYTLGSNLETLRAGLAKAQADVQQVAGDRTLDRVTINLKPGQPSYVFYTSGADPIKYTVDASTGKIDQSGLEESFILRLHNGEILGEAGKALGAFWGIALVLMTLSGLGLYLQMWLSRRKKGRTRLFW